TGPPARRGKPRSGVLMLPRLTATRFSQPDDEQRRIARRRKGMGVGSSSSYDSIHPRGLDSCQRAPFVLPAAPFSRFFGPRPPSISVLPAFHVHDKDVNLARAVHAHGQGPFDVAGAAGPG